MLIWSGGLTMVVEVGGERGPGVQVALRVVLHICRTAEAGQWDRLLRRAMMRRPASASARAKRLRCAAPGAMQLEETDGDESNRKRHRGSTRKTVGQPDIC
jgi:hypothetical protein